MGKSETLKSLVLVLASLCFVVVVFLLFDFLFSSRLVPDTKGNLLVYEAIRRSDPLGVTAPPN